jgi:DNA-binding NarL/FixJ family response regulator
MALPTEGLARAIAARQAFTWRKAMNRTDQRLTPRELDVLALLTMGATNRDIAAKLNLETGTVKYHLNSIYRKLSVSNRTEAALVGLGIFPVLRVLSG